MDRQDWRHCMIFLFLQVSSHKIESQWKGKIIQQMLKFSDMIPGTVLSDRLAWKSAFTGKVVLFSVWSEAFNNSVIFTETKRHRRRIGHIWHLSNVVFRIDQNKYFSTHNQNLSAPAFWMSREHISWRWIKTTDYKILTFFKNYLLHREPITRNYWFL